MRQTRFAGFAAALLAVPLATLPIGAVPASAGTEGEGTQPDRVAPSPGILDTYSRFMFGFNREAYRVLDDLGAYVFGAAPPEPEVPVDAAVPSGGLGNVAINLINEPMTALSGTLIGDWPTVWVATQRFGINSTVGLLGWHDIATDWGYDRRELDLGLALCAYGVDSGPYLVVPFIGPRTVRDAFTDVVVTNAILWTAMWAMLPPSAGLWAIAAAEAVEVVADIAATRQIDSHARAIEFVDYEAMRADYLRHRNERCDRVRGLGAG